MIIYFAGSTKVEEIKPVLKSPIKNWGILLSYKDTQTKDKKGSKRFKNLMKRKMI